jgi:hypothetical protein
MWLKSRAAEIFTFRNTRGGNWPQKCYKSYRGPTKTHANHHIQGISEHKWNNVTSLQMLGQQLVYKSVWFKHWEVHSCGLHTFFSKCTSYNFIYLHWLWQSITADTDILTDTEMHCFIPKLFFFILQAYSKPLPSPHFDKYSQHKNRLNKNVCGLYTELQKATDTWHLTRCLYCQMTFASLSNLCNDVTFCTKEKFNKAKLQFHTN